MKLLLAFLAVALVALAGCQSANTDTAAPPTVMPPTQTPPATQPPTPPTGGEMPMGTDQPTVTTGTPISGTTFTVVGRNFKFVINGQDNPEIHVKQGETIHVDFSSGSGFHDFVIDELKAKTPQLQVDKSASIDFVADKKGTFEYYCSVGTHRAMGMKGKIIVE